MSQLEKIERNRKPAEERPPMMNRSSGSFSHIAPEFEDWAIVADDNLRQKIISNLETTKTEDSDKIRRRTKLANQFANSRLSRITTDLASHSATVGNLSALVGEIRSIRVDGAGDTPAEISDMASDMRQGLLSMEHRARNAKFTISLINANLTVENLYTQNVAEIQRTKGWAPILQTYEGLS